MTRASVLVTLLLSACIDAPPPAPQPDPARMDARALAAGISGSTQRQHDRFYGTQIEYFAPDGQSFLWSSGRRTVVPGQWLTRPGPRPGDAAQLCFRYGADRALAADPAQGGNWTCVDGRGYLRTRAETAPGDPLGLAMRTNLPGELPAGHAVTLAEAKLLLGPGG